MESWSPTESFPSVLLDTAGRNDPPRAIRDSVSLTGTPGDRGMPRLRADHRAGLAVANPVAAAEVILGVVNQASVGPQE